MRLVVTGHLGWIGGYLTKALELRGHTWYGFDIASKGGGSDLTTPGLFRRRLEALLSLKHDRPLDAVIHLAAQPGRVFGEDQPADTIRLNAQMSTEVAKACGELGVRLIYTSTSEVYGDHGALALESSVPRPKNLYGLTKLWGEQVSELYAPDRLLIVRPTMPYGPGLKAGYGRAALTTFISNAAQGKPLPVHEGASRSWCYIDDLIDAFVLVLEDASEYPWRAINIGRDDDLRSMREIAEIACQITGADYGLIEHAEADPTITLVKSLSTSRLWRLGFKPKVDLVEGMRRTAESMRLRRLIA